MSSWRFKTVAPNVKPNANGRSFKLHKAKSQTQDASKKTVCSTLKKKNSKCINAWKGAEKRLFLGLEMVGYGV